MSPLQKHKTKAIQHNDKLLLHHPCLSINIKHLIRGWDEISGFLDLRYEQLLKL